MRATAILSEFLVRIKTTASGCKNKGWREIGEERDREISRKRDCQIEGLSDGEIDR